jgi:hypothetical protein
MSIEHPGSIQIVTWKDRLPDYIEIKKSARKERVAAKFGNDEDETLERYRESRAAKAVMDIIFEDRVEFKDPDDIEECVEIAHSHENRTYFAAEKEKVVERLR